MSSGGAKLLGFGRRTTKKLQKKLQKGIRSKPPTAGPQGLCLP
jgi:hypothetical protein